MSSERVHRFNLGANLGFSRHDCPNCGPEALHKHAICSSCGAVWIGMKQAAAQRRKAWSLKKAEDQGARMRKARAKAAKIQ